jgi:predicted RNase H-like HicB family nuclease
MQHQQIIRIQGKVGWRAVRTKGGNWVAACNPLKITLQSETWAELMEDIALALDAVLKEMLKSNELDRFLKDQGWKLLGTVPNQRQKVRFDVPFIPAVVSRNGFQRELRQ